MIDIEATIMQQVEARVEAMAQRMTTLLNNEFLVDQNADAGVVVKVAKAEDGYTLDFSAPALTDEQRDDLREIYMQNVRQLMS